MKTNMLAVVAAISAGLMFAGVAEAKAPQCHDATGKFIKCPPPAPVKCKDATGKFAKCGTPGAKPVTASTTATTSTSTTMSTSTTAAKPTPAPKPN